MLDRGEIRNWTIYKITSPSGRVYVGKTSKLSSRKSNYKTLNCSHQSAIYKSLKKYGFDNHYFEIIDSFIGNNSRANSKEMFWIRTNMSNCHKWPKMRGLNLTDGGEGLIGNKASKETKEKQAAAKRGKATWNKGLKGVQKAWNKGLVGVCIAWNKGVDYSHISDEERKQKFGSHNIGNSYNKGIKQKPEFVAARIKRQIGKPLEKKMETNIAI